jgi:glutamine amidotransferase
VIAVVDYGMGNLHSVAKALEAVGAEVKVTSRARDLRRAERIVLPGQGAFRGAIAALRGTGLVETLTEEVRERRKPFLGLCLGLQLLAEVSYEDGEYAGLGWLPARVERLAAPGAPLRLPHMGWNEVTFVPNTPLARGLRKSSTFYFAHSYHLVGESPDYVVATCSYGQSFAAAIQKDNLFATQFHPEKSQQVGLRLLENFLDYAA